jgi:hypothetical protein
MNRVSGHDSIRDLVAAAGAVISPTPSASPMPATPQLWQQSWLYEAIGAFVALAALIFAVWKESSKRAREREAAASAAAAKALAEAEAKKRPSWRVSFDPGSFGNNYFELKPTHKYGNGTGVEIPLLVKNVGERLSSTFQVELYVPRELKLSSQTDGHGTELKTQSNVSPIPGSPTWAIRFRSWDKDLRPDEVAKLGTFILFFDLGMTTPRDYKLYWRLTSQENGYVFPRDEYGQIGVRFDFS